MKTLQAAADRLSLSRAHLRAELRAEARLGAGSDHAGIEIPAWLARLQHLPGAAVLSDTLLTWWARSPWRVAGQVATEIGQTVLWPLARRHPVPLVLGAMLAGGLLAWRRPWRRAGRPRFLTALVAGLGPQLLTRALARMPVQPWLAAIDAMTQRRAAAGAYLKRGQR